MTCACEKYKPTTWSVISEHNCLDLQPITYKSGWEWYRILAFEQSDVRHLFKSLARLGTPEVTNQSSLPEFSLRDSFVLSTADLFGRMTKKQSEALAAALRLGYFNVPRKTSTDEIAKVLGRPATTFREHLQKGESKLLKAVEPYLELRPG